MNELTSYLKSYFPVAQTEMAEIVGRFRQTELKKGEFFLQHGRTSDRLGFVQSGLLRVYRYAADREVTQWISTAGYFVTDLAGFVFDSPARWDIQALTDCRLHTIDRGSYNQLSRTISNWAELDKRFIARCFVMLEERMFSHLYMTAEERYHALFSQQPELFNQVSLQYLASMLGMTPETLSRLRNKSVRTVS